MIRLLMTIFLAVFYGCATSDLISSENATRGITSSTNCSSITEEIFAVDEALIANHKRSIEQNDFLMAQLYTSKSLNESVDEIERSNYKIHQEIVS